MKALRQGERMVRAPPRRGECKPEALPQDSEGRLKALLEAGGAQTRANMSPIGRHGRCRAKTSCPLGREGPLGTQERGRLRIRSSIRKGLLRPRTSHRASTPATKQEKPWPCKSQVSQRAPARDDNHAPGTHPPFPHPAVEESTRSSS